MMLGGFFGVVFRMKMMTVGDMRMMGGRFVIARLMVLGSFGMMLGRVPVMFGGQLVMFVDCVSHLNFLYVK